MDALNREGTNRIMSEIQGQDTGRRVALVPAKRAKLSSKSSAMRRALSIDEFCERYGIGRSCVYQLINSGKLRSVKIGKRRLIPVDAAELLLQEGA